MKYRYARHGGENPWGNSKIVKLACAYKRLDLSTQSIINSDDLVKAFRENCLRNSERYQPTNLAIKNR